MGLAAWLLGGSSPLRYGRPLALVLMLLFVPALTTLHAGQVNAFVLLCLVIGMTALPQAPAGAGAAVAFAAMLKTVPLAHVLYLGWRRQTRAFLAAIVALFLLAVAAVPLVSTQGLSSFVRNLAAIGQPGHMFPVGSNQAVSGLIARILVSSGDVTAGTGSVPGYTMMWAASVAILTLITVLVCWPRGASSGLYRLEYGLVTVTVCLITPYTWYHQLVLLFIPFFVLIERALANSRSKWILAPIALAYVATDIHGLAWHHMRPHPFLVSLPSISALLIWLLLARSIVWEKLPDPEEPEDGANAWRLPSEGDN